MKESKKKKKHTKNLLGNVKRQKQTINKKQFFLFFILGFFVVLIDQLTKFLVRSNLNLNEKIDLFLFDITFVKNRGIAFGLFNSSNIFIQSFLTLIISLILLFIFTWIFSKKTQRKFIILNQQEKLILSIIFFAAISNIIDRFYLGYITDFIDFRFWPVFNMADSLIFLGFIYLFISFVLKKK